MKPYDPDHTLISLHIPKTAGTSFRGVLETWFADRLHLHYPAWGLPLGGVADARGVCIHGHFNVDRALGVQDCYPDASQFITVLRDPFARFVSLWFFLKREQALGHSDAVDGFADFDAWFAHHRDRALDNPASGFLRNFPEPVTAGSIGGLFDRAFVGVGLTERMQDTVDVFAAALGRDTVQVPRENVSNAVTGDLGRYRAAHERAFALEHEVYAVGTARFEQSLADLRAD